MAKSLSKEEKEKLEKTKKACRDTLESRVAQAVIGGSAVKKNPYDFGRYMLEGAEKTYSDAKFGEEFGKRKQELYNQAKENWDPDNAEEPFISDGQVVQSYFKQRDECFEFLTLGELESIVKGIAGESGPKINLRDELKSYSLFGLQKKLTEEKRKELSPEEKIVATYVESLKRTYTKACGRKAGDGNFYAEENAYFEKLNAEYNKINPERPKDGVADDYQYAEAA